MLSDRRYYGRPDTSFCLCKDAGALRVSRRLRPCSAICGEMIRKRRDRPPLRVLISAPCPLCNSFDPPPLYPPRSCARCSLVLRPSLRGTRSLLRFLHAVRCTSPAASAPCPLCNSFAPPPLCAPRSLQVAHCYCALPSFACPKSGVQRATPYRPGLVTLQTGVTQRIGATLRRQAVAATAFASWRPTTCDSLNTPSHVRNPSCSVPHRTI